jgi:hypothetical protein
VVVASAGRDAMQNAGPLTLTLVPKRGRGELRRPNQRMHPSAVTDADADGLLFYDPDGGYVAAYQKDYGYSFYGWKNGVMIVQGPDGSLWSALACLRLHN